MSAPSNSTRDCATHILKYMKLRIKIIKKPGKIYISLSQWPRRLRRRSAVASLLGLLVPIPPGHGCLSLSTVVYCQVEVSAMG